MIKASDEFKSAVDADFRQVKTSAVIDFTAVFLDESITQIVPNGAFDYLNWDKKQQITNAVFEPTYKYFRLGESTLNSGDKLTSADNETGWWSEEKSLGDRTFTESIIIEIGFSSRSIEKVLLYGENKLNEYPVAFDIELYNNSWQLVVSENDNDAVKYNYMLDEQMENITGMRVTINKWSKAYAHAKIIEAYAANMKEYTKTDINSFAILEERNFDNGSLPIGNVSANELSLSFRDDELSKLNMVQNKPISMQIGCVVKNSTTEFVTAGVFYSKNWTVDDSTNVISVTAHDAVSLLNETTFSNSELQYNQSLKTLALSVLSDSQLLSSMYCVDDELDDIVVPVIYFDTATHMNTLKKIVEAALGAMYSDKRGVVQVLGETAAGGGSSVKILTKDTHILDGLSSPVDISTIKNVINIYYYEYTLEEQATIYESIEEIDIAAGESESVTLFFQTSDDVVAFTNVITPTFMQSDVDIVIDNFTAYTWGIEITLKNEGATDQSVLSLTVEGQPLRKSTKVYTASDTESILKYGKQTYELKNYLIQSKDRAKTIAESLLCVYNSPNKDTVAPTWGDPTLEVGDVVALSDSSTNIQIYRQKIKYDGGLEIELNGRSVS